MKPPDYFHLGRAAGLRWYTASLPGILAAGRTDANLGAALIAATSPRCPILDNLRRALRGDSPMPCHKANLSRAWSGPSLRGPKVEAFRRALAGDLEAIPLDSWMLRAYGDLTAPNWDDPPIPIRNRIIRRINRAAQTSDVSPRDYAAAVWCGIIIAHGREPLNYGEALRRLTAQEVLWPSDKSL